MAKAVLMEEFHLSVFIPRALPKAAAAAIRRALGGPRFRAALRHAVREVFHEEPSLRPVRVTLTR